MEGSLSEKSFTRLYTEYYHRFVRFAYGYVRDKELAEDLTMDALMAYWENRKNLHPASNVPAYVLTIIKNKCLNYLAHLKTKHLSINKIKAYHKWDLELRITSLKESDPDKLISEEIHQVIKDSITELPDQTRKIFILSRYQEKSYGEIAKFFGITTKGVEFHMTRALKVLRTNLRKYLVE